MTTLPDSRMVDRDAPVDASLYRKTLSRATRYEKALQEMKRLWDGRRNGFVPEMMLDEFVCLVNTALKPSKKAAKP